LINRDYRGDINPNIIDLYNQVCLENDEFAMKPILVAKDKTSFFHTRVNNLIFLAVCNTNANAMMVFAFLFKFIQILKDYFKEVEEESIRDNFVLIHEIMDEVMDNGYPQFTEHKVLQEYITNESYALEFDKEKPSELKVPVAASNMVSWRTEGITYKKNEIFLDCLEKLNMVVDTKGNVVSAEVLGVMKMNSFLSGMPECILGLNDQASFDKQGKNVKFKTVNLDDVVFHQCVRLPKFATEREISFIPPDGEFELFNYRMDVNIKALMMVDVFVDSKKKTTLDYIVKAKTFYKAKCIANNVEILIPVPCDAENPTFNTEHGSAVYSPDNDAIKWELREFAGQREVTMEAAFHLPSIPSPERENFTKLPITVNFEIPYFTISGIQVRYLSIHDKSGYQAFPWVRYVTQSGLFQIRTNIHYNV